MSTTAIALRERCPRCGVRFEREEGYFLGAYGLNLIVAEFLGLGLAIVLIFKTDLRHLQLIWQEVIAVALAIAFPVTSSRSRGRSGSRWISCSIRRAGRRAAAGNTGRAQRGLARSGARGPRTRSPATTTCESGVPVRAADRPSAIPTYVPVRGARILEVTTSPRSGPSQPPSRDGRPSAATKAHTPPEPLEHVMKYLVRSHGDSVAAWMVAPAAGLAGPAR